MINIIFGISITISNQFVNSAFSLKSESIQCFAIVRYYILINVYYDLMRNIIFTTTRIWQIYFRKFILKHVREKNDKIKFKRRWNVFFLKVLRANLKMAVIDQNKCIDYVIIIVTKLITNINR